MIEHSHDNDWLLHLAGLACDNGVSDEELGELDSILLADDESRREYLDYCQMLVELRFDMRAQLATQKVHQKIDATPIIPLLNDLDILAEPPSPPAVGVFPTMFRDALSYISSGWPLAYMIATMLFGITLFVASFLRISQPDAVAVGRGPAAEKLNMSSTSHHDSRPESVARVTAMIDCEFSDPKTMTFTGANISLGRKYAMSAGLMEISYVTGAKVFLQGPCTYEVTSAGGGYLSIGKLTARIEQGEKNNEKSEGGRTPQIANHKLLSALSSPLFAITTPSAVVTDLGTEFGVEVDSRGNTMSHVFRGTIEVRKIVAAGKTAGVSKVLRKNETAAIGIEQDGDIVVTKTDNSNSFVREIPKTKVRPFDLVDVVAGGNGFTGKRGRGIDPTNGEIRTAHTNAKQRPIRGDNQYHVVKDVPFVDGVFIANGGGNPVQISSTGLHFDGFEKTDGMSYTHVWAGGPLEIADTKPVATDIDGVDYAADGHGLLFVHANNGITFDMDAIRKANPRNKIVRFEATAGNTETASKRGMPVSANCLVLVDGKVRFERRRINRFSGAAPVSFHISDKERFLTLVATDAGGMGMWNDWIIFGDAKLMLQDVVEVGDLLKQQDGLHGDD